MSLWIRVTSLTDCFLKTEKQTETAGQAGGGNKRFRNGIVARAEQLECSVLRQSGNGQGPEGAGVVDPADPAGFSARIDVTWRSRPSAKGKYSCDTFYARFCMLVSI